MAESNRQDDGGLSRPADAQTLLGMLRAGVLPWPAVDAGLRAIGEPRPWRRRCDLLLLSMGGGLLLAGIIFFVAFNWLAMDKLVKLGGLQALILACAGGAWLCGLDRLVGRALLFAACVLVGVFLAAFGQIYQTGADAWQLFRGWALLILIWVIAARAPVHWLLLLAVTDTAIVFYLEHEYFYRWESALWAWLILAATQLVALAAFELAALRGYFRIPQVWPRWLLVPLTLFLFGAACTVVVFDDLYVELAGVLTAAGIAGSILGGYAFYRHKAPDLPALTCIGFFLAWVITMLALRVLHVLDNGSCSGLVAVGLLVIGMLTLLVRWVRKLNVEFLR